MEEKKDIIFHCGKELFSSKGFKDTKIADIAKMAGMAVGTFYNYYPSKESLFLDIYLKENYKLKERIKEEVDVTGTPIEVARKVFYYNISGIESNPILKQWYNKDLFSKLEKDFHTHQGMESIHELMNKDILELIRNWKAEGEIRDDLDDELILALFNVIPYVDIHKQEIGLQHFPQILDYLLTFIMEGITKKGDKIT